jgi:hypothetical protein
MYGDLLKQYIGLIDYINKNGKVTLSQLQADRDIFDLYGGRKLANRTFHNHIEKIYEIFGIEIVCNKSDNTYYIGNQDDLKSKSVEKWLIETWSLSNKIANNRQLHDRILTEETPSGQRYLNMIIDAMKNSHTVSFTYNPYEYNPIAYIVKPLYVKVFKRRWYLIALDEKEKEKVYGLDRMSDVCETNQTFQLPKDLDPQGRFAENYGMTIGVEDKTETIVVKVDKIQRNYLRDLPLHESQNEIEIDKKYSLFEFRLKPTVEFIMEIMSYGTRAEIIRPQSLRDVFANKFAELNKIYKTTN